MLFRSGFTNQDSTGWCYLLNDRTKVSSDYPIPPNACDILLISSLSVHSLFPLLVPPYLLDFLILTCSRAVLELLLLLVFFASLMIVFVSMALNTLSTLTTAYLLVSILDLSLDLQVHYGIVHSIYLL